MNIGRIIWWLVFIVFVLGCAGAVALTIWAYKGEEQKIQDKYAKAMHSCLDNSQSDAAKAANGERALLFKELIVSHKLLGDGIAAVVILFSCLSLFLLTTCLIERRRIAAHSQPDVPSYEAGIAANRVASLARTTQATSSEKPHGGL